ncbi:MAG: hypothetical protein EZS28_004163 [Streblomastix strix]|uniref:Uncharacterized protein n=1 Tax=Streblomastix strix TaxID=222440 RepID=A0A5J4WYY9_9EUKA|nr:MAG: hypothetical protein EZS28_004163 [Streblomastix strix]
MVITISTAGGSGEEQDLEIRNGLLDICWFLRELQVGRNDNNSSFQPLPLHAKRSIEQIEEEGANEEIDAQMNNKGYHGIIKFRANEVKAKILNCFIHNSNLDPY